MTSHTVAIKEDEQALDKSSGVKPCGHLPHAATRNMNVTTNI
jgi:hypothetical protein